jgi:hypothetical protein
MAPLAPCGLIGIAIPVPRFRQDKLTRAFLISQQVIPYRTRGDTCCPGVSTPKIRSLADSSRTLPPTGQRRAAGERATPRVMRVVTT